MAFDYRGVLRSLLAVLVFALVLAILPFTTEVSDIKILLFQWAAFIGLAVLVASPFFETRPFERPAILWAPLAVFVVTQAVAACFALNTGYAITECVKTLSLYVLFVLAAQACRTLDHFWFLARVACVALCIASVYGICQHFGMDPFPWEQDEQMLAQAPSTFANPNSASHALVIGVILALGWAARARFRWPLVLVAVFAAHFALTQTRGSFVALASALALAVVAVLAGRLKVGAPAKAAVTFGVLTVLAVGSVGSAVAWQWGRTGLLGPTQESLILRCHAYQGAAQMIQDAPITGRGPGHFRIHHGAYLSDMQKRQLSQVRKMTMHAHNEPLEFAIEGGLACSAAYVATLIFAVYYALLLFFAGNSPGQRTLGLSLAALFSAFLVDGSFGFNTHVPVSATLLFVLLGSMAGLWPRKSLPNPEPRRGLWSVAGRTAAVAVALAILAVSSREFLGQYFERKGEAAYHLGEYDTSYQGLSTAAALAPHDWQVQFKLGSVLSRAGRPDLAIPCFLRTLELNPSYIVANLQLARAEFDAVLMGMAENPGQALDRATAYASGSLDYYAGFPEAHDLLGRVSILRAQQLGDTPEADIAWAEAEQHLLASIACGSKVARNQHRLVSEARSALGNVAGAEESLARALECDADDTEIWAPFLELAESSGRYQALLQAIDWQMRLQTQRTPNKSVLADLSVLQAKALFGAGRHGRAVRSLEAAAIEFPENRAVQETLEELTESLSLIRDNTR